MHHHPRLVTGLGLLGYLLIGMAVVLIPSVMPSITAEFTATGLSLGALGLIFPARAVGGILGNLLAGLGSDRVGYARLVWISALALAACLALASWSQPWLLFVLGFVLVSMAQEGLSTGINAVVADANPQARAQALNILHGVYGVGATISPLIIGGLLGWGLAWRWALGGMGAVWLLFGLVAYFFYRTEGGEPTGRATQQLDLGMLRQGEFLSLFLISFIYNGVAYSLLGWVALFMQDAAGFSAFFSIGMVSVFYLALTAGRFLCAAVAERLGYSKVLLILAVGITLTYPLVVLGINSFLAVIGVFLTGLSLSGLFPTALAYGSRLYPTQTGTVTGTLKIAMTLGAMLPPLWTGVIAEWWTFQGALGLNYILVLPMILIALYLGRREAAAGDLLTNPV